MLEHINKELRRRSRPIVAFPNDAYLLYLAGTILTDMNEGGSQVVGICLDLR